MTKDRNSLDIEFGLNVVFQNNENTLLNNGEVAVYPVGGMMTEFAQIDPTKIKEAIKRCGNLSVPLTSDKASELFLCFTQELRKECGHATTCTIIVEFLNSLGDWPEIERQGRVEETLNKFRDNKTQEIWSFIFEDSGYDDVGIADFGQALYTAFIVFSDIFVGFKYTVQYRRVYHRYKSAERRHPGEIKYIRALQSLTEGMKEWREKLKCGSATTEMFLDWINTF